MSYGYRHAVSLLLTNGIRGLPHDGSPVLVAEVLARLARDLVALADDMRAPAEAVQWTTEEYANVLARARLTFSHRADADFAHVFETAAARGAEILEAIARNTPRDDKPRDVFLMYAPQDRLPIAAPLAIELTKRRVTVAFSDYEVATCDQLIQCLAHGLEHHRAGVLLATAQVMRNGWKLPDETDRFRVLRPTNTLTCTTDLIVWLTNIKARPSRSPGPEV